MNENARAEKKPPFPFQVFGLLLIILHDFYHSWKTLPVRLLFCAVILVYLGGYSEFLVLVKNVHDAAVKTVSIARNNSGGMIHETEKKFTSQLHELIEKTADRKIFKK